MCWYVFLKQYLLTKKISGSLIGDNGLHKVLDMFAQLIHSGKDVYIDRNTKLQVYTFSPPTVVGSGRGRLFFTANMSTFLRESRSVVEIKNDKNNMCFSFAYVLGLAHLKADQSLYKSFCRHKDTTLLSILNGLS